MADTLFIQFYGKTRSGWFDLCNGFSDTWKLCQRHGDFLWLPHLQDQNLWYTPQAYANNKLPLSKGIVYISASYINHLFQAYTWAVEYPGIQFIVGGPVAAERCAVKGLWHPVHFKITDTLPRNLTLTGQSMEAMLGAPDFCAPWRLELPPDVPEAGRIYFSYTLDNRCYWSRCPFCTIAQHAPEHARKRKALDFEFKNLPFKGHKIVRLNTGSITPEYIRQVLPHLPRRQDMEYRYFMRAAKAEANALRKVVKQLDGDVPASTIGFGIEFASQRMWDYLDKGTRMQEVIDTLELCRQSGFRVNANMILGWNNLTDRDLSDLTHFMDSLGENAVTTIQLRWLFAPPFTRIYQEYDGVEDSIQLGPFNCGFHVKINDHQKKMNLAAADIIKETCIKKNIVLQGYKNLKKGGLDVFGQNPS